MATRIITSIVALPFLIGIVAYGGMPLRILLLLASLIAMNEFYKAFSSKNKQIHGIGYIFAVVYYLLLHEIIHGDNYFNIFVSIFLVVILIYTVVCHKRTNALEGMETFFGFFYGAFLLSHILLVREYDYGHLFVWLIFISAWGCDTGAYFTGMALGKHKLIPDLSPKKTVEGSIGGIVTATVIAFFYGLVMKHIYTIEDINIVLLCTIIGAVGSVLAQIGDLAASAMKRYTKIKDFGKLLPGHGGIIDRFDSVLLTAPAVYYTMFIMMRVLEA